MMRPKEDEGRYTKIIYFKENPKFSIPKNLTIYGPKKSIFGYGFYQVPSILKPEIAAVKPDYLPYEPWTHKITSVNVYEDMKKSSFIRFSTNNCVDFDPNKKGIYFADDDCLYQEGIYEFMRENISHKFNFIHPIEARDPETAKKFITFSPLFNKSINIRFRYDEDFFFSYAKENILFPIVPYADDTTENYLARMIKMGLWYKKNNIRKFQYYGIYSGFRKQIFDWIFNSKATCSFEEYYKDSKRTMKELSLQTDTIRTLLKQQPETVTRSNLDLCYNL